MDWPLAFTFRHDPYIQNGEIAYLYENGDLYESGRFRKIRSDHHSGGGALQFNYLDTGETASCGQGCPGLLTLGDLEWFKSVVAEYGTDYNYDLARLAKSGNKDVMYLLSWLESAEHKSRLQKDRDVSSLNPFQFLHYWLKGDDDISYLHPGKFLEAVRDAQL
ncbi:MAG: hypothetical protein AAB691_01925 [Patescibacteria group bacterium]